MKVPFGAPFCFVLPGVVFGFVVLSRGRSHDEVFRLLLALKGSS